MLNHCIQVNTVVVVIGVGIHLSQRTMDNSAMVLSVVVKLQCLLRAAGLATGES